MNQIRIFIADDHEVIRDGVKALLEKNERFSVIGEASDGQEALEKILVLKPDIVLMDISMPRLNGIEAAKTLMSESPDLKIIILSMHVDTDHISACLELELMGYVVKTQGGKEIIDAIDTVDKGKRFYSKAVTNTILQKYQEQSRTRTDKQIQRAFELTAREHEVITLISQGLTNQKIADKLFLSFRTIETHRANLMRKLEAKNSIELINKARSLKLID